jgi:hypothetical protein
MSSPSDETIRKEFIAKHPDAVIVSIELIWEQDNGSVYIIKYTQKSSEILTDELAMHQKDGKWQSCDDRTEVKCQ